MTEDLYDEVKQREEEDPYDIHQMPVQTAVLQQLEIVEGELILPYEDENKSQYHHAYNDMQGMKPGHKIVKPIE
jgi:hypothetical protein